MNPRLYLHQPTVVFRAQINQTVFTYPMAELTYDTVTVGAYTDIQPGMTMVISSAIGEADGGRQRIRKAADGTKVYFGRSSRGTHDGEVDPQDDWYIEVWDDYRVWAKVPQMPVLGETVTTYKDHDLAVGTYTTNPPPVANLGPGFAGTMDAVSEVAVVNFFATNSFAVADGATITGYLWDVGDGTITFGSTATEVIEVEFPAGFRWVALTVTDSNGSQHTARAPVYVRDPDADTSISAFEITRHRITPQGQEISLSVRPDIWAEYDSAIQYPDGTLAMIWDDDVTPNADRQGMMFIGWHHTDPAELSARKLGLLRTTTLELRDVAGKLDTLPGFAQVLYSDTLRDPATHPAITWEYMVAPTIQKYLHYLLHWHSTALEVADFRFRGSTVSTVYPFLVLESGGASLFDQVAQRAQQLTPDHVLTCTRRGQLAVWPDPMLLDPVDRTEAYQGSIADTDWSDMRYTHQRSSRVHWLRGGAVVAQSGATYDDEGELAVPTVFCVAPGEAPGQGEIAQEENERLALSQEDLNRTIGHKYARVNAPESTFTIDLVGSSDLGLEPADLEWVWLKLTPDEAAQRGMFFETMAGIILVYEERGLVHEIAIRYRHSRTGLTRDVQLVWERELDGPPAVTVIPPVSITDPGTGMPDDYWDLNPGEIEYPVVDIWAGDPQAYLLWNGEHIFRTWDVMDVSPTWEFVEGDMTGTVYDCQYVLVDDETVGVWALTDTAIWWCGDILAETPVWDDVLPIATVQAADADPPNDWVSGLVCMAAYAGAPGYLCVATGPLGGSSGADLFEYQHAYFWHTHDYGATWTQVDHTDDLINTSGYIRGYMHSFLYAMEIFRSSPGTIYCVRGVQTVGASSPKAVFVSSDLGTTWTKAAYALEGGSTVTNSFTLLHPYPSAGDPSYVVNGTSGASIRPKLVRSTDEWATGAVLTNNDDPTGYGGLAALRVNKRPDEPGHVLAWFRYTADADFHLLESDDYGESWALLWDGEDFDTDDAVSSTIFTNATNINAGKFNTPNGWPSQPDTWFVARIKQSNDLSGIGAVLAMTTDHFATVADKSGNLYTLLGGSGNPWADVIGNGFALPKVGANV